MNQSSAGSLSPIEKVAHWVEQYKFEPKVEEFGRVVAIGDGTAWIDGLSLAAIDDLLECEDGSVALVYSLSEKLVGAMMLIQTENIMSGTLVHKTGRRLSVPVGDSLLGRVIDPLGNPLDGGSPPITSKQRLLEVKAPAIIDREFVNEPLYTGNKIVDAMIPIGKGQRELLIGDNGLGKTTFALDTIANQKDKNVLCVYCLIGQKRSTVVHVIDTLKECSALDYTTVVVAEATSLPGLQYIAPFAACTIAEEWMEKGRDTLVIYDDLSLHAQTYRELSLLLRRPPGREAYPGDVFYLHSRLLERSTHLSPLKGGGSMTALPIVETQQGELAAYIPTNLISITDGQIYFEQFLFSSGFLPAIDVTRSVSRIGGAAQHPHLRKEAGRMKLDYLQFLELEVFTRFGTKLEASLEKKIKKGRILRELLKQERLSPISPEQEYCWLIAFNEGLFDDVPFENLRVFQEELLKKFKATTLVLDDPREKWLKEIEEAFRSISSTVQQIEQKVA
ncbi:ATP F0F1 synthase subunit alpha [Methylacidiphilum kamchatkense Kam1]|uniref:ATP synthase subunit alpha n=1 Tax=Methylacidiphilum kamchatkense Kam1 TaxID=1202785 RepID=A0A0C1V373_9BACT|nr:F0F1 ATP synthase subunit alpha [Methylacidiphilum kamchatkense]KIE58150.1 ATP F0F1 synthase subunit alpha [Methylacidiphilum kamchatkense Kam1]QDQ42157.1 F-type H+-transporting ATPase subunit alpha [Methylacidiphilum kamchatkense Kam1]